MTHRFETDPETGELIPYVPFLRTPYNYDRDAASIDAGLSCPEDTLTQQSGAEDTDINEIVRKFGVTGELPQLSRQPLEGDFADINDFHSAMLAIRRAEETFMELPADIRTRFDNDPGKFHAFAIDEKNMDELRTMGLAKPATKPPEAVLVRMVDQPAPDGKTPPEKQGGVT